MQNLETCLVSYCEDVLSGAVVACQKHKWAASRFLRDRSRAGTPDFPYVFDSAKGDLFLDWMRIFKHTKGVLAGERIEPHIIHKFVFGNVYGWVHRETGHRRFKKMYWQVARKNTKSQSLALVALFELFVFLGNQEQSEVYIAATKREQARIVYDEAHNMLKLCGDEDLRGLWVEHYHKIEDLRNGSFFRALSDDDRKSGDGLNPQCAVVDEYHAHETSAAYDVLDSGMGARSQPLMAIITTAGFELNNPCYRVEYSLIARVLDPDNLVELDTYFALVCELEKNETSEKVTIDDRVVEPGGILDDISDPRTWEKANPIVCSYPEGVKGIADAYAEMVAEPEKGRNFLTKRVNVWVNQRAGGYMNMAKWALAVGEYPDLDKCECYIGLDLSARLDLTSVGFVFKIGGKYYLRSHSFTPEDTLQSRIAKDKMPFDLWVAQGWLTAIPGEVIDYRVVKKWVFDEVAKNNWIPVEWCLDMWSASQLAGELKDEGHEPVPIRQGTVTLSEPTSDFRAQVYAHNVVHDDNPVLTWAVSNAIADVVDKNENIMLNKKKSTQRIDPIAAILNAYVRAMVSTGGSVYNRRGLRSLQ